jgi:hypothetical protein
MLRPAWNAVFLFVLLCVAGMTGTYYHTQPLIEIGSHNLFAWVGLEL